MRGKINDNVTDSTSSISRGIIGEDILDQVEDYLVNNTDTTSVTVYRSDLMISKSGIGYFLSGGNWIPGDAQWLNI